MSKRRSIRDVAAGYSLRERHCEKCIMGIEVRDLCPYIEICHEAYIRGFLKGRQIATREKRKEDKV